MEEHGRLFNGIGWSPDGKTMYVTQSLAHAIFSYDFDLEKGLIANRRIFIDFKEAIPDGLAVDAEGCLWSAHAGGGKIVRYTPKGKIDRTLHLPVPRPSSCTFGGADLKTLFITTARELLTKEELEKFPLSGDLFSVEVDVKGKREAHFG
jgi:sugar lactone lactonase YvrE